MRALAKLKSGDFNTMSQEWESGDVVVILLAKRGERVRYRLKVRDLYQSNEQVLEEEVIEEEG